ncbi:FGGY family carbohydrate kinase [Phycicoccus sp.]|uniref:FGGY-family carbohydrate kinase n=1 Tax=Phycicoccus sp. TaxID=1902410 RepID=UPI002B50D6F2|nr:FGGY family carbohydrate kinase [Phycicoccus sp.]HMM93680.1 FGGY family carbohydrate kinase [Phycicoccus sp.]
MTAVDLGVDLGTTVTKVAAVADDGTPVLDGSVATAWEERGGGRFERSPASVVDAVEHLLAEVVAGLPAGTSVRSVGFTSMAEAGTLLDSSGAAQSPVMAWHDPRGDDQSAALDATLAREFLSRTGLPVGHVATLFKLLWLRDEGLGLRGLQWLGAPELVVHRLGGRRVAERSLLGRTGLLDVHTDGWWRPGLDLLGVGADLLPEPVGAGAPVGTVRGDHPVPALRGAVLTVAGHDHAVAAAATGCGAPGSALDSFGTAEAYLAAADHVPDPDVVGRLSAAGISVYPHVVRGSTALIGGTRTGLVLKRVQQVLGAESEPARSALDAATLLLAPGDTAEVRVTGYGMEDHEVGVHLGSEHHTPAHVWRAALDGGTDRGRALLATLRDAGVPVERLVVAGGWTRMASVLAARRDLAPTVEVSDVAQPGTWGAARFGAWAATHGAAAAAKHRDPRPPAGWFDRPHAG